MKQLQRDILKYLKERGWDTLAPANVAKSIMIEGAELLEHFQWSHPSIKDVKKNADIMEEIKKELADVFIYALEMSVLLDIDAETVIRQKLAHVKKKYPAQLMKSTRGKKPGTDDAYLRIKKEYRRKGLN